MVEKRGTGLWLTHLGLIVGIAFIFFPIWLAFVASTVEQHDIVRPPMPLLPGDKFFENYARALTSGINAPVATMLWNSLVMAMGIALGKIAISLLSAFAIVYFRFPGRQLFFWLIFLTLMLPVEVRIVPTYEVIANFGMLNSYQGLILPLIASATATFLFRQFFMTVPDELADRLRERAKRNHRSLQGELLSLLEALHAAELGEPLLRVVDAGSPHGGRRNRDRRRRGVRLRRSRVDVARADDGVQPAAASGALRARARSLH